jgi:hypothetical protein
VGGVLVDPWAVVAVRGIASFDAVEVLVEQDMTCAELHKYAGLVSCEFIGSEEELR